MNPITSPDIPSLVIRLKNGDEDAFCLLFHQFGPRIYGTARRMFLSHEDAEELVQEVFLKIWKKKAHLKDDLSFHGYLITIMKSLVYKKTISKSRFLAYQKSAAVAEHSLTNEVDISLDFETRFQISVKAIEELPKSQKAVIELKYLKNQSADEIAEHLRISKRTVESHIYKATKTLRQKLAASNYIPKEVFVIPVFLIFF
jgi:RNA polymerase sigma factor (sigma-70 family)